MNTQNQDRTVAPESGLVVRIAQALLMAATIAVLGATPHASAQMRSTETQRRGAVQETRQASAEVADASAAGVVNIQTASLDELQRLPGIGPSKAAAIVAQRERAAFRRVEDILRVRGIGRATFRRLRPMITVTGPTTLAQEVRMPRRASAESDGEEADAESAD